LDSGSVNVRDAMAFAVRRILDDKAYTGIVLDGIIRRCGFDYKDSALLTGVVNETVRMKRAIDHVIDLYSKVPSGKLDALILSILRTAAAQMIYFDRLPSYAVVNESVTLVKKYRKQFTGYANAILRKIAETKGKTVYPDLCTELSYEDWMYERWSEAYGKDFAVSYMTESNKEPGTSVRVNLLKTNLFDVKNYFVSKGHEIIRIYEPTGVIVLRKATGISDDVISKEGKIVFQDEAAARVCMFLDPAEDETILDMCAAPGGKTFFMAQLMKNRGSISARDISERKIDAMRIEAVRLGAGNVMFGCADAVGYDAEDNERFDKVLADVPCTGTGIIRKKPEIKWNRKPGDIKELNIIQSRILKNAYRYLKYGGELVYSTCSIEREENEAVIEAFLSEEPGAMPVDYDTGSRYMKLFPNMDGTDGFFAAKIKKAVRNG
jgi:16S rRNA (cytosine967-C5)-methyltransferase